MDLGLSSPISHCVWMHCNVQETDRQKTKQVCELGAGIAMSKKN